MRFVPRLSREEIEARRIHAGDAVLVNNERCIVVAVGLRYARVESVGGRPLGLVKLTDLRRADVRAEDRSPLDELPAQGYASFDRESVLPKRR